MRPYTLDLLAGLLLILLVAFVASGAELGAGAGSSYPSALDTDTAKEYDAPAANKTRARAAVPNDLAAALIALENELGINPSGSIADLATWLGIAHNTDGTHKSGATYPSPTITGNATASTGSAFTASTACTAGYTRVGSWCYDTDGSLATVRSIGADESAYTTTVVNAAYKAIILHTYTQVINDASAGTVSALACAIPGDSAQTTCNGLMGVNISAVTTANDTAASFAEATVRLDSSGQVKTFCEVTGTISSASCVWYLFAYLD